MSAPIWLRRFPFLGKEKVVPVFAIRCGNASSELAMLSVLHNLCEASCPLAPVLVQGGVGGRAAASTKLPVVSVTLSPEEDLLNFDLPLTPCTSRYVVSVVCVVVCCGVLRCFALNRADVLSVLLPSLI
jgi:hypothetical protein